MFRPGLPRRKAEAIARLGMGVVDKLFITFESTDDEQLEPYKGRSYNLLWQQQPEQLSTSTPLLSSAMPRSFRPFPFRHTSKSCNSIVLVDFLVAGRFPHEPSDSSVWFAAGHTPELGSPAILRCFAESAAPNTSAPWHQGLYSLRFGGCEFIRQDLAGQVSLVSGCQFCPTLKLYLVA